MRLEGEKLSAALEDCLPDFQFAFEGNGAEVDGMYYHTDKTRQLNAHFGDMLHKIQDLEVGSSANEPRNDAALTWCCTITYITLFVCMMGLL